MRITSATGPPLVSNETKRGLGAVAGDSGAPHSQTLRQGGNPALDKQNLKYVLMEGVLDTAPTSRAKMRNGE